MTKPTKPKIGFYAPDADVRRARAAFVATRALPGQPRTFSDFCNHALMLEVERLEQTLNHGEPFPEPDEGEITAGRPFRA